MIKAAGMIGDFKRSSNQVTGTNAFDVSNSDGWRGWAGGKEKIMARRRMAIKTAPAMMGVLLIPGRHSAPG